MCLVTASVVGVVLTNLDEARGPRAPGEAIPDKEAAPAALDGDARECLDPLRFLSLTEKEGRTHFEGEREKSQFARNDHGNGLNELVAEAHEGLGVDA